MRKTLFTGLLVAAMAIAGWRYAPPQTREALLGFIGMASRRDVAEVRRAIGNTILPDDPVARRTALARDMKRSIRELQRRVIVEEEGVDAATTAGFPPDEELSNKATAEVLAGAGNAIAELEEVNKDASVGTKITERILERILPAVVCKE